jgi:hypothetical protein
MDNVTPRIATAAAALLFVGACGTGSVSTGSESGASAGPAPIVAHRSADAVERWATAGVGSVGAHRSADAVERWATAGVGSVVVVSADGLDRRFTEQRAAQCRSLGSADAIDRCATGR